MKEIKSLIDSSAKFYGVDLHVHSLLSKDWINETGAPLLARISSKDKILFLTVNELSLHLSMSEDAIRVWIKSGRIPFYKFGRAIRFDLSTLERWIKSKEVVSPSMIA